jgi:dUTP pyrophosphatase
MNDKDGIHAMQLKVQKKSDSRKLPVRKTPGSAGMDIGPGEDGVIEPGETKQIHTGIAVEIPPNHFIWVHERSSMRNKVQISGIIDSDYRDELLLIVTNHTTQRLEYTKNGKAIAQLIIIPYASPEVIEVKELGQTDQKGGIGSTDSLMEVSVKPGKLNFKGTANGAIVNYLVDSGADGIFGGKSLPKELGMTPRKLTTPMTVTTANNEDIEVTHQLE